MLLLAHKSKYAHFYINNCMESLRISGIKEAHKIAASIKLKIFFVSLKTKKGKSLFKCIKVVYRFTHQYNLKSLKLLFQV